MQILNNKIVKFINNDKLTVVNVYSPDTNTYQLCWINYSAGRFELLTPEEKLVVDGMKQSNESLEIYEDEKHSQERAKAIAMEILQQLGGRQFSVMVGLDKVLFDTNYFEGCAYIHFKAKNTKNIKYVKIYLINDLYVMEFYNNKHTLITTEKEIYCDQLAEMFEKNTGLYTKLF